VEGRALFWGGGAIALFGIERSIALYDFFTLRRAIALFGIERSIALYNFLRAAGDRSFWYPKVDRPLQLFHS